MNAHIIRGFSLLEIMVAFAVIGIGMSSALSITSRTIDSLTEIETKTYAYWLAENQIVTIKLMGDASPGEINGDVEYAGREWFWRANIKATDDEDVLELNMEISTSEDFEVVAADLIAYTSRTEEGAQQ